MQLVEKVLLLKSTDLFRDSPEQSLVDLASVMEMRYVEAGQSLFLKGDNGDSLFIILKGSVKVHDGEHEFARLSVNEFFGELSLLDHEPRSASVTALDECTMLQLSQGPFYEAIGRNPEVLKSILRTLCHRIRIMNNKDIDLSRRLLADDGA
jgi:CRP-like cAMP-binding protein